MSTVFIPNPNFIHEVLEEPMADQMFEDLGEQGLEIAQRLVPVDTGELHDSLHTEELDDGEPGVRIVAGTDHWMFPEFGTSETPAQPYLRPVLDELGLHK